jgi:hypothetical protein
MNDDTDDDNNYNNDDNHNNDNLFIIHFLNYFYFMSVDTEIKTWCTNMYRLNR